MDKASFVEMPKLFVKVSVDSKAFARLLDVSKHLGKELGQIEKPGGNGDGRH
jgi:hypothetical protein